MESTSKELISEVIKKRKSVTHKGNYGWVLLIGESKKYGGALIMSAEGALNNGTGPTTAVIDSVNTSVSYTRDSEIMALDWKKRDELKNLIVSSDVVVCGTGLGLDDWAHDILAPIRDSITSEQTLVSDVSALDLTSQ